MVEMTQEQSQIARHIEDLLRDECREQELDFTLRIVGLSHESEWMYFMVKPDQKPGQKRIGIYDYADVLASVETRLRMDEHVEHVLLVPAFSD